MDRGRQQGLQPQHVSNAVCYLPAALRAGSTKTWRTAGAAAARAGGTRAAGQLRDHHAGPEHPQQQVLGLADGNGAGEMLTAVRVSSAITPGSGASACLRTALLEIGAAGPLAGGGLSLLLVLVGLGLASAGVGTIPVEPAAFEDSLLLATLGEPPVLQLMQAADRLSPSTQHGQIGQGGQ